MSVQIIFKPSQTGYMPVPILLNTDSNIVFVGGIFLHQVKYRICLSRFYLTLTQASYQPVQILLYIDSNIVSAVLHFV